MEPHEFWQGFLPATTPVAPPFSERYPAILTDGRVLMLPIRPLAGTSNAIASLILNQSSFEVEDALAEDLTRRLRPLRPDIVVGLPTLGLSLARLVAQKLGQSRYVALGTSKKFWYDPAFSVPLASITSPGQDKRLYIDPRMLPLVRGARVCLIDDVVSSGASMEAGLALLSSVGVSPVGVGAAMLQTRRWAERLAGTDVPVIGVFETPLLTKTEAGWVPAP